MNTKKKLFKIFGPAVLAAVLLGILLISPFNFRKIDQKTLEIAAVSQSKNIFKGTAVKKQALKENYVAFFGSSELSRMDSFHPAALALRYKRSYRPFLLGGPGSTSLSQFFGMQGINQQLKNKKAVMIISPQWFVKQGTDPGAFSMYYSNLQTVTWLENAKNNKMSRYAAKRLLSMSSVQNDTILKQGILRIAQGKKLQGWMKTYLSLKYNQLEHEDELFSTMALTDNTTKIAKVAAKLPKEYNFQKLDLIAYEMGKKNTTNNKFDINNKFFDKNLAGKYQKLKNKQRNYNYVKSPEYADFQLVLNQFAQNNTNVIFVIPPVNHKWSQYTGLSEKMLKQFNKKIKYQLKQQGFINVVDLSNDGGERYFMEDTIHLGWRGWLEMDRVVSSFLTTKQKSPSYKINNYFYSKTWQQLSGSKLQAVTQQ